MENKFIIQDPQSIVRMVDLLDACSPKLQVRVQQKGIVVLPAKPRVLVVLRSYLIGLSLKP